MSILLQIILAIRCRFTVALLDETPQYEALSYVWGDITDTRSVEVEERLVHITANLHSALIGRCPKMRIIVGVRVINYEINSLCYQSSVATSQAAPSASPLD
jgi:hypothetical protein